MEEKDHTFLAPGNYTFTLSLEIALFWTLIQIESSCGFLHLASSPSTAARLIHAVAHGEGNFSLSSLGVFFTFVVVQSLSRVQLFVTP